MDDEHPTAMETFVVRVWHEDGEWRGKVVHLPDRRACFFATWAEVLVCMRRLAGWIEDEPPETSTFSETSGD